MPAANIATKYNPILWINSNLDDPRQIREIMREMPYWAMDIQRSVTTLLSNPTGGGGTGTGDMTKAVYDTNNNGIVDSCDSLPYSRLTGAPAIPAPSSTTPLMDGSAAVGAGTTYARADHVHPTDTSRAPLASPTFTGTPAAPTATAGTATTQLATTAFVGTALSAANVPAPSSTTPAMDGTAAVGVGTTYARSDHVHPSDTSRVATTRQVTTSQSITGGGDLSVDRTHSLVGDTASPGGTMLYGTNGSGVRGWYPQPVGTGGDMTRAVYDTDANGVVDTCDSLAWAKITGAPLASSSVNGLLKQVSGSATDLVDGTNNCQSIDTATRPTIYSVRLRSWNAVGNPTFEVDQRSAGNPVGIGSGTSSPFICDRWSIFKSGTMALSAQTAAIPSPPLVLPGTNFGITQRYFTLGLTGQDLSLAGTDYLQIVQSVEGPMLRELASDVHSVSLLVNSNIANLKFALAILDVANNRSLCKLCTLGTASQWTLITLPNLPAFQSGVNLAPGTVGYTLRITLAAGAPLIPPANDVWNAGTFVGAIGMDNFASKPIAPTSTFSVAFVQHEPGPVCTTLMDKPFAQNYDECLRYFQKSYDYGTALGTVTAAGMESFFQNVASTIGYGSVRFHKPLAKASPTITLYDHNNGAVNSVMDGFGVHHTGASASGGTTGIYQINFTTATTAITPVWAHHIVDTGW